VLALLSALGLVTATITKLLSRDPTRRLRLSVNAFLTYPFGRPGYRFDDVVEENGRALDMRRCPVADFLGQRNAADLCAGSWCNLDYALAEMWGARLERTSTLVAGASRCDFRFVVLTEAVKRRRESPPSPHRVDRAKVTLTPQRRFAAEVPSVMRR
jgi:hypothetical protein